MSKLDWLRSILLAKQISIFFVVFLCTKSCTHFGIESSNISFRLIINTFVWKSNRPDRPDVYPVHDFIFIAKKIRHLRLKAVTRFPIQNVFMLLPTRIFTLKRCLLCHPYNRVMCVYIECSLCNAWNDSCVCFNVQKMSKYEWRLFMCLYLHWLVRSRIVIVFFQSFFCLTSLFDKIWNCQHNTRRRLYTMCDR